MTSEQQRFFLKCVFPERQRYRPVFVVASSNGRFQSNVEKGSPGTRETSGSNPRRVHVPAGHRLCRNPARRVGSDGRAHAVSEPRGAFMKTQMNSKIMGLF